MKLLWGLLWLLILSSCATFKSLNASMPLERKIFIYSGTRLDWHALMHNEVNLRKFNVEAPEYPLLDLPASCVADTAFLPAAVMVEIFH